MADESVQSPKPSLALNILNYMLVSWNGERQNGCMEILEPALVQLHPVCREEMKSQKKTLELEQTLQQCLVRTRHNTHTHTHFLLLQGVLDYHFSGATPTNLTFDLLREMLSVYLRLALHRAAAAVKGGGCEVVRERVGEIREWSEGVLIPLLRGEM